MKLTNKFFITSVASAMLIAGCGDEAQTKVAPSAQKVEQQAHKPQIWPKIQSTVVIDPEIEKRITRLLAEMTLAQKVAQMIQPEIRDITVEDMRKYGFGSYLNGGGAFPNDNKHATPKDWIKLAEDMYNASVDDSLDGSNIPTIWGTDAVHGHNNVIGATLFPHNIGLGAANNPDLIEKIAAITATEVMVTGIDWVFAPTVAVVRDDRWGRTYEGYSEDPDIVRSYSASIVKGLQGQPGDDFLGSNRVISTVKHFIGDGGTENGDDQGNNTSTEQELFDIHAQGYVGGLTAGAQSVMASFNRWQGEKIHGNKYLLTDVLKDKMGFDGFVVGDWNGHGQVAGCTNESCAQSVNAGLDIFMVPTDAWKPLYENTIAQVKSGVISQARIDDAVSRILRVKLRAGVFDKPSPAERQFSGKTELIGAQAHRDVARQAVRESLVLLKNNNNLLPLTPKQHILIAGDGADNIGKQSGGWSITWQGTGNTNADFPGGSSIYQGIAKQVSEAGGQAVLSVDGSYTDKPDVAIVVFGEEPYAEGQGDIENLAYQAENKSDLALLKQFKDANIPVVALFISGRPMWVNAELNASDAFVAVWLPGSEGDGVAEVILANAEGEIQYDFTGKLSYSWPNSANQTTVNRHDEHYKPLFPYGYGLSLLDKKPLADDLDETFELVASDNQTLAIFNGGLHAPWQLDLFSGQQEVQVNSNTHQLSALSYRTIDRLVQEDAFKVSLQGKENAGVRITSINDAAINVSALTNARSMLQFTVKLDTKPSADVFVGLSCASQHGEAQGCEHSENISKQLAALSLNEWHVISIDLACFSQKGLSLETVNTVFEISSTGTAELSLTDISIAPIQTDVPVLACP